MFIAREKYHTNIIEYVLYIFHIEDVIRVNKFSLEALEKTIIPSYNLPENQLNEVRAWYSDLINQMKKDEVLESGHITPVKELIFKLNDLHIELLNSLDEERYIELYHWSSGFIRELKAKMKHPELTEVEVCLNGLYEYMLLKMKGQNISMETTEAMSVFSQMMRYLSKKYNQRFRTS
jgi:hypothetical protein